MRRVFVIGLVTSYMAIISYAVPAPDNRIRTPLTQDEKNQSEQLVLDLARNFSSYYFRNLTQSVEKSQILSPLSIFIPLSILSYGARGETRNKFLSAIGLPKAKTRMAKIGYKKFLDKLASYDVRVKTKMFVCAVGLQDYFVELSMDVFNSEFEHVQLNLGFLDSPRIINWVAEQTNLDVKTQFHAQQIGHYPSIILVNTIHFKGTWKKAFDESRTESRPFQTLGGSTIDLPTMYTVGHFQHGRIDEINANFIRLPYKANTGNNTLSMFVILPDNNDGTEFKQMTKKLKSMSLKRLLDSTEKEIEVYLPKFEIATHIPLKTVFQQMFQSANPFHGTPDFSGIFLSPEERKLGESVSIVVIKVDEKGQETDGSSGLPYVWDDLAAMKRQIRSIQSRPLEFKVNRPFVAIITTEGEHLTEIFSIIHTGN